RRVSRRGVDPARDCHSPFVVVPSGTSATQRVDPFGGRSLADAAGSLELIAVELANLLRPLADELTPERAQAFFVSADLPVTSAQVTSMTPALGSVGGNTGALDGVIANLRTAIAAGNGAEIVAKGVQAIDAIAGVITGIGTLSSSIPGATAG